jgi:hypothetical protein
MAMLRGDYKASATDRATLGPVVIGRAVAAERPAVGATGRDFIAAKGKPA